MILSVRCDLIYNCPDRLRILLFHRIIQFWNGIWHIYSESTIYIWSQSTQIYDVVGRVWYVNVIVLHLVRWDLTLDGLGVSGVPKMPTCTFLDVERLEFQLSPVEYFWFGVDILFGVRDGSLQQLFIKTFNRLMKLLNSHSGYQTWPNERRDMMPLYGLNHELWINRFARPAQLRFAPRVWWFMCIALWLARCPLAFLTVWSGCNINHQTLGTHWTVLWALGFLFIVINSWLN